MGPAARHRAPAEHRELTAKLVAGASAATLVSLAPAPEALGRIALNHSETIVQRG